MHIAGIFRPVTGRGHANVFRPVQVDADTYGKTVSVLSETECIVCYGARHFFRDDRDREEETFS